MYHGEIDVYNSEGEYQSEFGNIGVGSPTGVAVNSAGYVYVVGPGGVEKFNPIVPVAKNTEPSSSPVAENPIIDSSGSADTIAIDTSDNDIYVSNYNRIEHLESSGAPVDEFTTENMQNVWGLGVDPATHTVYAADDSGSSLVNVFAAFIVPGVGARPTSNLGSTSATLNGHIDPLGGGEITNCHFEYGTSTSYGNSAPCAEGNSFSAPADVHADVSGLTTNVTYHFRLVASNAKGTSLGPDRTFSPSYVFGLSTEPVTNVTGTGATLNGSLDPKGEDTHYYFQYGTTLTYGKTTATPPGVDAGSTSGETQLHIDLADLDPFTTYHYRIAANNGAGTSFGNDLTFKTLTSVPLITDSVSEVHSDRVALHAEINPGGIDTIYHFEYGTSACSATPDPCTPLTTSDIDIGSGTTYQGVSALLGGLAPGTTYHYRVLATNSESPAGGTPGPEHAFTTFAFIPSFTDPCPNAHVRQQTGSALLLDCRAYELVSASNAGGYDVESNLVPGQSPFGGYPDAHSSSGEPQVLYGIHNGGIPGTGNPTDNGVDPYVATRTETGWSTKYVGIPANNPFAKAPFASTLAEADPSLDTFAFGGEDICSPCFQDGSTGIPIHLPNGELVQGMAGSLNPGAEAKPAGFINKRFSADGSHFVFGSKSRFEPEANEGEISIYDRDLKTDETHVVSKTPAGQTIKEEGTEIGELGISKNGSRIVIGHLVEEKEGAKYWHLYMNVGDSGKTIDLTPGTTHGALFDGMTEDGSKVFFTTVDPLSTATNQDSDHSADIYQAEVSEAGAMTLTRISTGTEGTGNTDSCDPAANTKHIHWNTTGTEENCGVVAIGGGGGVASGDGTIYFLYPEQLDGSEGVQNAPNLYVARPGGVLTLWRPWSRAPMRQFPLRAPRFYATSANYESGRYRDRPGQGDSYVLDIGIE